MSRDLLDNLLENLKGAHAIYRRLLDIACGKKAHILANDIPALREDIAEEERLAEEGTRLNAAVEALRRECCLRLNLRENAPRLEDLCARLPSDWRSRILAERNGLRDTLCRLQEINRVNVALVNNSLDLMGGLLAALFGREPVTTYGRSGLRTRTAVPAHALNTRV